MTETVSISPPAVTTRDKLSDILYTFRSFDQGGYKPEQIEGIGARKLKDIEGNINHRKEPFDRKFIARAKEIAKQELAKQTGAKDRDLRDRELKIRLAQYRALELLYPDNLQKLDLSDNPLEDILVLIGPNLSFNGSRRRYETPHTEDDMRLCIQGSPVKKSLVRGIDVTRDTYSDAKTKEDQYIEEQTPSGKKQYRTLARFDTWQTSLVRGMYLIARVSDENPELLDQTLTRYCDYFTSKKSQNHEVALGLLDVLNNANLLDDPHFIGLSSKLRKTVLDGVGNSYDKLKEAYYYRVVDQSLFWQDENSLLVQSPRPHRLPLEKEPDHTIETRFTHYPSLTRWERGVAERRNDLDTLRTLTPRNAIVKAIPGTEDQMIQSVVKDTQQAALINSRLTRAEKQLLSHIHTDFEQFILALANGTPLDSQDNAFLADATGAVMRHFKSDDLLSQKTKSVINGNSNQYHIKQEKLPTIPLVRWLILFKKDSATAGVLKHWAQTQPESLYVLFKSMTYDVAKHFYATGEKDFLFDDTYAQKAKTEDLVRLINEIDALAQTAKQDVKTLLLQAEQTVTEETAPLIEKEVKKQRRRKLLSLRRRHLPIVDKTFPVMEKWKTVTKKDIAKLALVGTSTTSLLAGGGTVFINEALKHAPYRVHFSQNNVADRIPEALPREMVANLQPTKFYDIAHLPKKYFAGVKGEDLGYFPAQYNFNRLPDGTLISVGNLGDIWNKFNNIEVVDKLEMYKGGYKEDEFAYIINNPPIDIVAPTGWKITRVIQEQGKPQALINMTQNELNYDMTHMDHPDDQPSRIILVLEKLSPEEELANGRMIRYTGEKNFGYKNKLKSYYIEPTEELKALLQNDPKLQELYDEYKDAIQPWTSGDKVDLSELSVVVKSYMEKYAQYIDTNRFYALSFKFDSDRYNYPWRYDEMSLKTLQAIADQPNDGFYCTIGSFAFQDFFSAGGIRVARAPGIELKYYNNEAWGQIAHMNNMAQLPNGEVWYIDMTPKVTDKTPQQDIDALRDKEPSDFDLYKDVILELAVKTGVGIAAVTVLYKGLPPLVKATQGKFNEAILMNRVKEAFSGEKEFSEIESRLIAATVSRLAFAKYDDNYQRMTAALFDQLQEFSQARHGSLVTWLVNSPEGQKILRSKNPQKALSDLKETYDYNYDNFRDKLPAEAHPVFEQLLDFVPKNQRLDISDYDVPYDFYISYQIAKLIYKEEDRYLQRRFAVNTYRETKEFDQQAIERVIKPVTYVPEKTEEIIEILRRKYALGEITPEAMPLFNAVSKALSSTDIRELKTTKMSSQLLNPKVNYTRLAVPAG